MTDRADYFRALCEEHIADGLHIEAGWTGLLSWAPPELTPHELQIFRDVYFAGAAYLFRLMKSLGASGTGQPTRADLELFYQLEAELSDHVQGELLKRSVAGHA